MAGLIDITLYEGEDYQSDNISHLTQSGTSYVADDYSTGYTAKMQIRRAPYDTGAAALLTLTDSSGVNLNSDGTWSISITAAQTWAIGAATDQDTLYYDLMLTKTSSAQVKRIQAGKIKFVRGVTSAS